MVSESIYSEMIVGYADKVDRPISTAIYFLLPSGSVSHLHRIPCGETWHFYMGEPLTLLTVKLSGAVTHFNFYCERERERAKLWGARSRETGLTRAAVSPVFELSDDGKIKLTVLGTDLEAGQKCQYTVPPNVWFGSFPTADIESYSSDGSSLVRAPKRDPECHYSLVGCTCAPAFQFEDFELASRAKLLAFAAHLEPFIRYLTFPD
ncbi:hypothetical protein ACLOJK_001025 [Asimina triloba]